MAFKDTASKRLYYILHYSSRAPPIMHSSPASILRILISSVLTCALLTYVGHMADKYGEDHISMATRLLEQPAFRFPSLSVCGHVPHFRPLEDIRPWVDMVRHDFQVEGNYREGV